MKVYIINSIAKSYILNIKTRPLVTECALMIKLVGGTSFVHSLNPYAYFGHSWDYFDIKNLRLVILYVSICGVAFPIYHIISLKNPMLHEQFPGCPNPSSIRYYVAVLLCFVCLFAFFLFSLHVVELSFLNKYAHNVCL